MRRALVIVLLLAALPVVAAEKWWDAYKRGVKAVNAQQYDVAVSALQAAVAEMPAENSAARVRNSTFSYIPHFWLGVAKFHLGDVDGALREWKISEEQGAIAKTEHYVKLREWVSRAQAEKKRGAADAASSSKKAADTAVSAAMSAQIAAVSAGADRSDTYRGAQTRLQEAMTLFRTAGTDVAAFERAEQTAEKARELFVKAADDARKQKAARPPVVASKPAAQPVVTPPVPQPVVETAAPPPVPISEPAVVETTATSAPEVERPAVSSAPTINMAAIAAGAAEAAFRSQLESAYRFFASGDLDASERALSAIIDRTKSGEAYLLRGCTRYTRALLSRSPEEVLDAASSDFKAALKLNRKLRLDKRAFSPKLVEFFESVRKSS